MSKVIFITGVSSGLGKNTAEYLAQNGFAVYGTSRTEITLSYGVAILKMDITDKQSIQTAINTVLEKEGKIDVLINNAGIVLSGSIEDATTEEINLQMDTNFLGTVHVIQAVLASMRKNRSGTIINISSLNGIVALPFEGFYCASKFAIIGFSDALRMEVKPFNIKVVIIEPGDFHTSQSTKRIIQEKALKDSAYETHFRKIMTIIKRDEEAGLHPDVLARKIFKIINSKNPKQVYVVSNSLQKLVPIAKRLLPHKWFYALISMFVG